MTTDKPNPVSALTASDMLYSLNGFDEIAIATKFNSTLSELRQEHRAIDLGRALAFVHFRREGAKDTAAWEAAQELTIGEVTTFFVPAPKAKRKGKSKAKAAATSPGDDVADAEGKA
jgi:hypothetical protein